jgi:hypothetical protein
MKCCLKTGHFTMAVGNKTNLKDENIDLFLSFKLAFLYKKL